MRGLKKSSGSSAKTHLLWKDFFTNPTQWYDNRNTKVRDGDNDEKERDLRAAALYFLQNVCICLRVDDIFLFFFFFSSRVHPNLLILGTL